MKETFGAGEIPEGVAQARVCFLKLTTPPLEVSSELFLCELIATERSLWN